MASDFRPPISIKEAIDHIDHQEYLLPAIQRKFVWSSSQIETLFDSIMRGYPINSFMLWRITDASIKTNFKFYKFLSEYREFFKEDNPSIDTIGFSDFDAVIDGQQRLTSLYIGLKGTYAYKMPRKWWADNEDALPTRRLYLNLSHHSSDEDDERSLSYDFKFLTDSEYKKRLDGNDYWFCLRDVINISDLTELLNYSVEHNLGKIEQQTLARLVQCIHQDKKINYYQEEKQDIDSVLDIFIRTNSGGVPLSFSNLLMSITIANWNTADGTDARSSLAKLVKDIFAIGQPGFKISEDFVLKTCLVLFRDNIKFSVNNFNSDTVDLFSSNWERICKSIVNTFKLLEVWGFNNDTLRAKNAVIPLIYFVYWNKLEDCILKKTENVESKNAMRIWLCIALLKGTFGGQSDSILTKIRKELKDYNYSTQFPLRKLIESFRGSDKNFTLDDDFIEGLLKIQKDSPLCYPLLALIYSHMKFETDKYHKDHLHPAASFSKKRLLEHFGSEDNIPSDYYLNSEYWNGIVNLQLLNSGLNESKKDQELKFWIINGNVNKETQLIPDGVSYDFDDFVAFYDARKKLLKERLKKMTSCSEDGSNSSNIMNSVIVDYTPSYHSFGWMGELHIEYNISTDDFQYRNGSMGRWNLSQEDIDRIKAFLSDENNLRDFFDDNKAYSTNEAIKTEHFRAEKLHFNWNGREKTISVGFGTDIPFKHPF